jgi:putative glutamine amidotransferase
MLISILVFDVRNNQYGINAPYIKFIASAGFTPILVTPEHDMNQVVAMSDGLVLPGGVDIDPLFYGEENFSCLGSDPDKDTFEREYLRAFVGAGKPVFGICRGFQLIVREFLNNNRHLGDLAEFEQHIQGHSLAEARGISRAIPSHLVSANVRRLYGKEPVSPTSDFELLPVNSMHHQGLVVKKDKVSRQALINGGLNVLAYTNFGKAENAKGVIVEAVELRFTPALKLRGVQWHPEELSLKNPRDLNLLKKYFNNHYAEKTKPNQEMKPPAPPSRTLNVLASAVEVKV